MTQEILSTTNAFIFHILNIISDWKLENPYYKALKSLLIDDFTLKLENLRIQQEYHFIAKIIQNEINENINEIKKNMNEIYELLEQYNLYMKDNDGNKIIHCLFMIILLFFFKRDLHYKFIDKNIATKFLKNYNPRNNYEINMKKILCLIYSIEYIEKEVINDNYDLALNILYIRLLLTNPELRNENMLIDYYIKNMKLEKMDISNISSEVAKGKLLEIAIIIKVINGKGLYLPEIEKENYLSTFTSKFIRQRYHKILFEMNTIKILNYQIVAWKVLTIIFFIETLIFALPSYFESITIPYIGISVPIGILQNCPSYIIIIINGFIVVAYAYFIYNLTMKRIGDEKWQ